MQVYVQKSTRTTLPRSDPPVNRAVLIQPTAPPRSGILPSSARAGRPPVPRALRTATIAAPIAGSAASPMIAILIVIFLPSEVATGGEGRRRASAARRLPVSV